MVIISNKFIGLKKNLKVRAKISELKDIDMKDVHSSCMSDLTDLLKFYGLLMKTKTN